MPAKKEECKCECHKGGKFKGLGALILGLLVLGNGYWSVLSWDKFIGLLLVLIGVIKLLKPKK